MAAHDSQLPGEEKPKHIRVDVTGGSMSKQGWGVFVGTSLTVILGSGGFVGFQCVTQAELKKSEQKQEKRVEEVRSEVKEEVSSINVKIGKLSGKVDDVQNVQVKSAARQEARQITEPIRNREERERQYDRLRDLNEKRIKKGEEPCANLQCSN